MIVIGNENGLYTRIPSQTIDHAVAHDKVNGYSTLFIIDIAEGIELVTSLHKILNAHIERIGDVGHHAVGACITLKRSHKTFVHTAQLQNHLVQQ